ncbi:MAG: exodeoxyribonuclease III [Deltaproteobacteria bacterium]|nr:exodeoxyribonuclease III [Deltaproteobacteria bacterium]
MKMVTWNINGIRAVVKKGFWDWLEKESPDILCLQETKAHPSQLDESLLKPKGYKPYWSSAERKGYSGVALFVKEEPLSISEGLSAPEFDIEGRTLVAEFADFILFNGYYPNGKHDLSRVPYKLKYSDLVLEKALELQKEKKKPIILAGDFNTAHQPIDLARPKENQGNTGFLPEERAWIDKLVANGFIDIFREHEADSGHYSWWSYRAGARERNVGWRIDYFFITPELKNKVNRSYYQPEVMGSDHCPVVLEIA